MLKKKDDKVAEKSKIPQWGTEDRFKDAKKSKSKANTPVVGPGHYPLVAFWPGKDEGKKKDKSKKNWMNSVSQAPTKSIYY